MNWEKASALFDKRHRGATAANEDVYRCMRQAELLGLTRIIPVFGAAAIVLSFPVSLVSLCGVAANAAVFAFIGWQMAQERAKARSAKRRLDEAMGFMNGIIACMAIATEEPESAETETDEECDERLAKVAFERHQELPAMPTSSLTWDDEIKGVQEKWKLVARAVREEYEGVEDEGGPP